jgi:signal transduction histidine kinase
VPLSTGKLRSLGTLENKEMRNLEQGSLVSGKQPTTLVTTGPDEISKFILSFIQKAASDPVSPHLHWVTDKNGPSLLMLFFDTMRQVLENNPNFELTYITDVQPENIEHVKKLATVTKRLDIRHIDGIKRKFAVSNVEYFEVAKSQDHGLPLEIVHGQGPESIAQLSSAFQILWDVAIPLDQRIKEIETGKPRERTTIVYGTENILKIQLQVISKAQNRIDVCVDSRAAIAITEAEQARNLLLEAEKRGVKCRIVTDITLDNAKYCKELAKFVEVRHLSGLKGNFTVTETEYLGASIVQQQQEGEEGTTKETVDRVIYSNAKEVVEMHYYLFETLWNKAIPSDQRIKEIQEGLEPEETKLITDLNEVYKLGYELIDSCKNELLLILASEKTIRRNRAMFDLIDKAQAKKGFKIRILAPFENKTTPGPPFDQLRNAEWRNIRAIDATFMIFDRGRMLITQYTDVQANTTEEAVSSNIYTTNKQTISSIVSIFNALWHESELREREEKARRQAELLQDILTHDIRNYNQASRMSAELLKLELSKNEAVQFLADSLMRSIDGSTQLLDKARKLGKILSEQAPKLYPVNLIESIGRSIGLVREAYPEKIIHVKKQYEIEEVGGDTKRSGRIGQPPQQTANVLADNLLDEVFVNLLSNSVKYTDGNNVHIEIIVKQEFGERQREGGAFWKVVIIDHGIGIPDDLKGNIFGRYFGSKIGTGLGMSIVRGLLVERYHGKINVRNTVPGDYSKGTTVDVWLPKV